MSPFSWGDLPGVLGLILSLVLAFLEWRSAHTRVRLTNVKLYAMKGDLPEALIFITGILENRSSRPTSLTGAAMKVRGLKKLCAHADPLVLLSNNLWQGKDNDPIARDEFASSALPINAAPFSAQGIVLAFYSRSAKLPKYIHCPEPDDPPVEGLEKVRIPVVIWLSTLSGHGKHSLRAVSGDYNDIMREMRQRLQMRA